MTKFYDAPVVSLLSAPQFFEPAHLFVKWEGEQSDGAALSEFAGRLCYMSQSNPGKKTTESYLTNIMLQGHGSVLEHANYSVLVEGISRSLSHETVRHRAGFAYSQLSQRYVDAADTAFVIPVAMLRDAPDLIPAFKESCLRDLADYEAAVEALAPKYTHLEHKTDRVKAAREAARELLPNATETKIVMTANVRAWRHWFNMRGALGADAQICRLAVEVFKVLEPNALEFFQDIRVAKRGNREYLNVGCPKV